MLRTVFIGFMLLSISACDSDLLISPATRKTDKLTIEKLELVSAKAGDQVRFVGKNLSPDLEIFVNDKPATFLYMDENSGAFIVPKDIEPGILDIRFSMEDKEIVKYPLLNSESKSDLPIIPVPEDGVCESVIYRNLASEIVRGKATCLAETSCSKDAETGCLTTEEVPAVSRVDLEANIASGLSLGSIIGTACKIHEISATVPVSDQPVSFSMAPLGTSNATHLNVSVVGSGITQYKYKIREPSTTACTVGADYSAPIPVGSPITDSIADLPDALLEICVIGADAAGHWQPESAASTISWTKDTQAPLAMISGAPTGTSNALLLSAFVGGSDVTHYKYKVRMLADAACSSPVGYGSEVGVESPIASDISLLPDGLLELCVIGRDSFGNWQLEGTATLASWTKDTLSPAVTLSNAPTGTNSTKTLNVTVVGTDVTDYKYKIRESATSACSHSSGYSSATAVATPISDSIASLSDGLIEICVIGKDTAGNWQLEASATNASWTKDTTPPTAAISGEPVATSSITVLDITVAGTDVTHYRHKVRSALDPACSVAAGYSGETPVATKISSSILSFLDGSLEVCIIGRDAAGNWQTELSATTASWTKDTLPGIATLSGAPTGTSAVTALDITVAGTDIAEYKYKIREAADTSCTNSTGYSAAIAVATHISDAISSKGNGTLQVCVIGKDGSGNWQLEGTATIASWTKDTESPTATLANAPSGTSNASTLNVSVAGADVTHYRYKIREASTSACSNSAGYSSEIAVSNAISSSIAGLADGALEICLIGRDASGNWQAEASATAAIWIKDSAAPIASLANAPSGTSAATALDVTIAGSDVSHYKYKIRSSADSACSVATGYSSEVAVPTHISNDITAMADGTIQICVIGRDSTGNWQAESTATTASWTKNVVPPTASLTGYPSGASRQTTLSVTVGGSDVTHYKYKIRGTADTACSDSSAYGSERPLATLITDSIAGKPEGTIEICVVGRGVSSLYQAYASATSVTWTKDTTAPSVPASFFIGPRDSALKASWTSGGGDTSGFVVLRRASSTISDAPTAGTSYAGGEAIGSSTVAYAGSSLSTTDVSLANGTKYFYRIFAYDAAQNYSSGIMTWGRPIAHEPPSADNLMFWTDSTYADSFFTDTVCSTAVSVANETVACWKDLSSTAATLTQAASGNRPVYKTSPIFGHPGFQHTDAHWLTAATSNLPSGNLQHSLVYIGSFGDTLTSGAIHIGGSLDDSKIRLFGDGGVIIYSFGNNDLRYTPPSTSPQVYLGTYDGINSTATHRKLYINGTEQTAVANAGVLTNTLNLPANPGITIGSNSSGTQGLTGDVGEFLIYDHDLSSSEIIDLGHYAWNKWNIPQIGLSAQSQPSSIVLTWTDGIASSSYLVVRQAGTLPTFTPSNGVSYGTGAQGSDSIVYASTAKTYADSAVVAGTTYYYSVYGNDGSNNYTPAVSSNAKILVTPALSLTPDNAKLNLSWSAVAESSGFLLVRRASSAPTFVPTNGVSYAAGAQGSDTLVYAGAATSFQDTGLTNGTAYHYKLYAYNSSLNYAAATMNNATPSAPCTPSSTTYTVDTNISMPSNCTTLLVKAWGGGGGGGEKKSGAPGHGGGGGYATRTLSNVNAGAAISIKVGMGGSCHGPAGTGYANGGAGGHFFLGSDGGGTGVGGAGGTSEVNGGAGKYGGGGGGGNEDDKIGGGGGGASAVSIDAAVSVIAGGGGGGGASDWRFLQPHDAGHGGAGCGLAGGNGEVNAGSGGGGGACLGASTANGSGVTPGNSAEAGGAATGGTGATSSCGTANHGKNGAVTLSFSP